MPTSAHAPQIECDGRQPLAAAQMRQGVEKTVGRSIAALAEGTLQPGNAGKTDEEVQGRLLSQQVQVPRPKNLGRQHTAHARPALLQHAAVVKHAGGVDDAAQRRPLGGDGVRAAQPVGAGR